MPSLDFAPAAPPSFCESSRRTCPFKLGDELVRGTNSRFLVACAAMACTLPELFARAVSPPALLRELGEVDRTPEVERVKRFFLSVSTAVKDPCLRRDFFETSFDLCSRPSPVELLLSLRERRRLPSGVFFRCFDSSTAGPGESSSPVDGLSCADSPEEFQLELIAVV